MEQVPEIARKAEEQFKTRFGRSYGLIERYGKKEAEVLLVTAGAITSTSRTVIQKMVEKGKTVGGLKIKMLRPLPSEEFYQAIRGAKKIAVIERDLSSGVGGIIAQELRASLYHHESEGHLSLGFVSGLGGRDITPDLIEEAIQYTLEHSQPEGDILWLGLKR